MNVFASFEYDGAKSEFDESECSKKSGRSGADHDDLRLSADVGVVDAMIVEGRRLFVNVSPEGDVDKDVAATSIDAPPDDTQATQPLGAY